MPRADYKTCRVCGGHTDDVGPLSHTRLCAKDAKAILRDNIVSLAEHRGPAFRRWRHGIAASVGAVLLDEQRAAP